MSANPSPGEMGAAKAGAGAFDRRCGRRGRWALRQPLVNFKLNAAAEQERSRPEQANEQKLLAQRAEKRQIASRGQAGRRPKRTRRTSLCPAIGVATSAIAIRSWPSPFSGRKPLSPGLTRSPGAIYRSAAAAPTPRRAPETVSAVAWARRSLARQQLDTPFVCGPAGSRPF